MLIGTVWQNSPMTHPSFEIRLELAGWELVWIRLTGRPGYDVALAGLRDRVARQAQLDHDISQLAEHPPVAAMRRLFRAAGCDPTRYRPSSEALLRRILKGQELPAIHPLVDLNNCLSVALAVPSCVMPVGSFTPPVTLRAGRPGESFASLRGPFHLEGKPLLADPAGPFGTPITDSERVKVHPDTHRALLVAYLPQGEVTAAAVWQTMEDFLRDDPIATAELVAKAV